ncbi:MAG: hypothetical protein JST36_08600 [Bacteroidetes bacterium]|nr:hypothetical protein [Bacteroidota bacterium]
MNYSWRLLLLILALTALYAYRTGDKPLDYDERYSLNIATGIGGHTDHYRAYGEFVTVPLSSSVFTPKDYALRYTPQNVFSTALNDNGQGLPYFLTLHYWLAVFGVSTTHARFFSLFLILLSVPIFYALLRRWGQSEANSLLFTGLFFCNGLVLGLAIYVRFYSMGILLAILSTYLVSGLYAQEITKRKAVLLGCVWCLFFFTQYFSIFLIAAQFLFLVVRKPYWSRLWQLWPTYVFCFVVLLLWLFPLGAWETWRNILKLQSNIAYGGAVLPPLTVANVAGALLAAWCTIVGQPMATGLLNISGLVGLMLVLPTWFCIAFLFAKQAASKPYWLRFAVGAILLFSVVGLVHTLRTGEVLLFFPRYWAFWLVPGFGLLAWIWSQRLLHARLYRVACWLMLFLLVGRASYTVLSYSSGLQLSRERIVAPIPFRADPDYESLASDLRTSYQVGDTIRYNSWKTAQMSNWFLLDGQDLLQLVDTNLEAVAQIRNGANRRNFSLQFGRRRTARTTWF